MAAKTPAGVLCAALLHTRDVAASARHYQSVFGWTAVPDAAGTSFTLGGQRVAAACAVVAGVDGWVPYVGVEDVDDGAARAARSGATVLEGRADASPGIRRRLVRDPGGAVLGLCGLDDAAAVELIDEPGSVWWMEVLSHTPARARDFYGGCCSGSSPRSRCRRTPPISSAGGAEPRLEGFSRSVGAGARRRGGNCCSTWTISPGPRSRSWMPADASSSARSTCRRRA